MSGLQLAIAAGVFVALSGVALVWWIFPGRARLGAALDGLGSTSVGLGSAGGSFGPLEERLGRWSARVLPANLRATPTADLALLRQTSTAYHGEKLLLGAVGLVFPPLLSALLMVGGYSLPWVIPGVGSLVAAVGLYLLPTFAVRSKATEVRQEFAYALTSYIDLVALERRAGSDVRQALQHAAEVGGEHWVFARLAEALAESAIDGRRPWDAFHQVASELGLPALDDLANIMALASEQSMPIYQTLLEHNRALRTAQVTAAQARSNAVNELVAVPSVALVGVLVLIAMGPQIAALLTG